jgi:Rrf2 family nitric oxide-sensitive transcriptional repressor
MRLTTFSDYSLRVLIYLGLRQDRLITIADIAQAYGISENHLMKVVHGLAQRGDIETVRGKGGGMRLARQPQAINIGETIRATEGDGGLLGCLDGNSNCCIQGACALTGILREAQNALYAVLDRYTLADLLREDSGLRELLTDRITVLHPAHELAAQKKDFSGVE